MNGAQETTRTLSHDLPVEAIEVVIGRFENWKNLQNGKSTPNTFGTGAASAKPGEAREISYEQALRARRHRPRYQGSAGLSATAAPSLKPESAAKQEKIATPQASPEPQRQFSPVAAPVSPAASPAPPLPRGPAPTKRQAKTKTRKPAPALPSDNIGLSGEVSLPVARAPQTVKQQRRKRVAKADVSSRNLAALSPSSAEAVKGNAAECLQNTKTVRLPAQPVAATTPPFREVFSSVSGLAALEQEEQVALESTKATSITLRVSEEEQARIQACAALANLSVSAYLRQCAFGVDNLRGQVELALTKLRDQPAPVVATPGISAIPGILRRFGAFCWRRLQGRESDATSLSLR